jgi:hypothetical protein
MRHHGRPGPTAGRHSRYSHRGRQSNFDELARRSPKDAAAQGHDEHDCTCAEPRLRGRCPRLPAPSLMTDSFHNPHHAQEETDHCACNESKKNWIGPRHGLSLCARQPHADGGLRRRQRSLTRVSILRADWPADGSPPKMSAFGAVYPRVCALALGQSVPRRP